MSVKNTHTNIHTTYFVTTCPAFAGFTCFSWLHLIEMTDLYDVIYKGFNMMVGTGNKIFGYTIMPNHMHLLIYLNEDSTINEVIKEFKRFRTYEIIKRLKKLNRINILQTLETGVNCKQKQKGAKHKVFEPACRRQGFI